MLIFISGGVRSGKSSLGERLAAQYAPEGRKVYLATTRAYDREMKRRILRHRQDRAGKGFVTLEADRAVGNVTDSLYSSDTVLLDCLGALASNEMFGASYVSQAASTADALADTIFDGIMRLNSAVSTLIIISNEVFSDGADYDAMTLDYIRLMGLLHRRLAAASDIAVECAAGCYITHKGELNVTGTTGLVFPMAGRRRGRPLH